MRSSPFLLCAMHVQYLRGGSPQWAGQREPLAKCKGVLRN